ncbi:MAG TPA: PhzF family phenazine biosynthesis protein [Solirubrobacteraceae bacterium]|jgi:predicted PhzF superfamily epimerase YddE/YHI9|nr:PhzF family phenazine biosynthesis protein [Solirubrobacteraceae bacterium]
MTSVRVLRVFTDSSGASGNPLGVVRDAGEIAHARRQAIASELGYSETVFVERDSHVQIFTPAVELPFAGHPMVGTAWLLGEPVLHAPAGDVATRVQADRAWVLARAEWCPDFERRRLASPDEVEAFDAPAAGSLHVWAWSDEPSGHIRARVFAPDLGVPEDPATGSATVALCAQLGRAIAVEQGPGCEIEARPVRDGLIELGGRVADDGIREL